MAEERRVWRWRTVADPYRPTAAQCRALGIPAAARVAHRLAHRVGEPVTELCRGSNGNALLEFDDGERTIAPWRAALRPRG